MMKLSEKNDLLIEIFFFTAIFNDILRIPNTSVTVFRIIVFLMSFLCISRMDELKWYFIWLAGFIVLQFIQHIVFIMTYQIVVDNSFHNILEYTIHYYSILIIFMMMKLINSHNRPLFEWLMKKGLPLAGLIMAVIYGFMPLIYRTNIFVANRNNYATGIAAITPVYLILGKKNKRKWILVLIIMAELFFYGSKAAFMGIVFEVLLFIVIEKATIFKGAKTSIVICEMFLVAVVLYLVIFSDFLINGYSIKGIFEGFVLRILHRDSYSPAVYTSLTYRTDAFIAMINSIIKTPITGIGPGNTSRLLRYILPATLGDDSVRALAPHCAYLEFMSDNGIWAILVCIIVYIKAIKLLLCRNRLNIIDEYYVIMILSLPIWVLSSSGIYTIYILFICMAWLLEAKKNKDDNYIYRKISI